MGEDAPEYSEPMMAILRTPIANNRAGSQCVGFIKARLAVAIDSSTGKDYLHAALRDGLTSSMLVSIIVGRRIIGVRILAKADIETLVATIAPAVRSVLVYAAAPGMQQHHSLSQRHAESGRYRDRMHGAASTIPSRAW